ncbi:MAG: prolipoprotein diacylglyceryl transferase [Phycisphaerales bacterium]
MTTLGAWLHTWDPFAIRFAGDFGLRWYGLSYIAGFVCAWLLLSLLAKRGRIAIAPERVPDAIFTLILGVLVGGRLGYIAFYQPSLLWTVYDHAPWWGALAITEGGMASHGGILGVILASWWIARREKAPAMHILDCVAFAAPIGLGLGRIANFINGELLGRIVAMPGEPAPWWAVRYPQELLTGAQPGVGHRPALAPEQEVALQSLLDRARPPSMLDSATDLGAYYEQADALVREVQRRTPEFVEGVAPLLSARHPSQLYQALAEGLILGLALVWIWRKPRTPGVIGAWFLIIYGVLRILTEFVRLPDDHLQVQRIAGLSRGQWLSVAMIAGGAVVLAIVCRRGAPPMGGWAGAKDASAPSGSDAGASVSRAT